MPPEAIAEHGFELTARTRDLLDAAETVVVVTNGRSVPNDYFQTATRSGPTVFVVFNRHRFHIPAELAAQTVWVHRLDEASGRYFGEPAPGDGVAEAFHYLRVAGPAPGCAARPADVSYLSYRAPLAGLASYPVGRRLVVPQHGIRRIVSPSTGFVVFALLAELQRRGAGFTVRAVGIGREYDGWPGHDWAFERRALRTGAIEFKTAAGDPDHWETVLDHLPYEVVRLARKFTPWWSRRSGRTPATVGSSLSAVSGSVPRRPSVPRSAG